MRRVLAALCGLVLIAGGCASKNARSKESDALADDPVMTDRWLVDSVRDAAIANAIIAQHTLYQYHFVLNSDVLNDLGRRDLDVLIDYYKVNPGGINIRRGTMSDDLYDARLQHVTTAMAQAGLDTDRIEISDSAAEVGGASSESTVRILQKPSKAYYEEGGSGIDIKDVVKEMQE